MLHGKGMGVALNSTFALACARHKLADQDAFAKRVWEVVGFQWKFDGRVLDYFEDTLLVKGLYTGREGRWLATSLHTTDEIKLQKPVVYSGHNLDTSADREELLRFFAAYIYGASARLDWE